MKKIILVFISMLVSQAVKADNVKEWTMLVFMNAHGKKGSSSDLTTYAKLNLQQMQSVGSSDQINIIAEVGTDKSPGAQRVFVQQGNVQVIQNMDNVNMGSAQELLSFIQWAVQNYPAKHYLIDIWNHGMGWHSFSQAENSTGAWQPGPSIASGEFHAEDISFDFDTQNYISTEQMGDVMRAFAKLIGHKVDIYGNDACEMAMAEIVGEIQDSVQYFVGSEEVEADDGWPYDKFLASWFAQPEIGADQISKILVQEYANYYLNNPSTSDIGATMSALDLNHFDEFTTAVANLKNELTKAATNNKEALMNAIAATDIYSDAPDYKDLGNFLSNIEKMNVTVDKSIADGVNQAMNNLVIANQATGNHQSRSNGISIWIPTPADDSDGSYDVPGVHYYRENIQRYKGLKFDQATQWSDLLTAVNQN